MSSQVYSRLNGKGIAWSGFRSNLISFKARALASFVTSQCHLIGEWNKQNSTDQETKGVTTIVGKSIAALLS